MAGTQSVQVMGGAEAAGSRAGAEVEDGRRGRGGAPPAQFHRLGQGKARPDEALRQEEDAIGRAQFLVGEVVGETSLRSLRGEKVGQASDGRGEPLPWPAGEAYDCGFGVDERDPGRIDLAEPIRLLALLRDMGVAAVNLSAGCPYTVPHILRPATFPPSDGYPPPEDPLVGVWRQIDAARQAKAAVPGLEKYHGTDTFLSDALTIEANRHIGDAVKAGKPFYLNFAHYAMHSPFDSDPRFAAHYRDSGKPAAAQAFATLIEGMDKSLGDLLDHLEKLGVADISALPPIASFVPDASIVEALERTLRIDVTVDEAADTSDAATESGG